MERGIERTLVEFVRELNDESDPAQAVTTYVEEKWFRTRDLPKLRESELYKAKKLFITNITKLFYT
jgi:hypothetical protein